jgi:hypothetical protein
MCTTGAKILHPGHEFILFKNRDFTRQAFNDRIHLTDSAFGVLGLETWDGDGQSQDVFTGFSIGFNQHLACCDSNVRSIPGAKNYDRLVQAVIEQCQDVDEAIACVRDLVERETYSWANMVVTTPHELAALEVRGKHVEVERSASLIARANHHVCLGAHPEDDDTLTTDWRYTNARQQLNAVQQVQDVFDLLRLRHSDESFGIANAGLYHTVYSYVVHWRDGQVNFYVLKGLPSAGKQYIRIPITLGEHTDLSAYPSDTIAAAGLQD